MLYGYKAIYLVIIMKNAPNVKANDVRNTVLNFHANPLRMFGCTVNSNVVEL